MKINLAKSAGFCFGVKRALKIALESAANKNIVEMLGDIVHNERVVQQIRKAGIKKIDSLDNGKGKILLIRAHGTSTATYKKARALGYKIIDATCPMVHEIHKIVRENEKKGYRIIVIGDKKHDEVQGILGQLKKKVLVIEKNKDIEKAVKGVRKAAVVVQSTQNLDKTLKIVDTLSKQINKLKFFNTICEPTRRKQKELKAMAADNDLMIVIGSKTSANTKRLYQISKSINNQTLWIQSETAIRPQWFREISSVGVIAGASTPESTIQKVIQRIKKSGRKPTGKS